MLPPRFSSNPHFFPSVKMAETLLTLLVNVLLHKSRRPKIEHSLTRMLRHSYALTCSAAVFLLVLSHWSIVTQCRPVLNDENISYGLGHLATELQANGNAKIGSRTFVQSPQYTARRDGGSYSYAETAEHVEPALRKIMGSLRNAAFNSIERQYESGVKREIVKVLMDDHLRQMLINMTFSSDDTIRMLRDNPPVQGFVFG